MIQTVIPLMIDNGGGSIVNISSVASSVKGIPSRFIYSASKAAVLGMTKSKILTPLNILWIKFGLLLGKIISPIVMGFVFFGVVTPISIIMKLFKKDLLNLNRNNKKSYWLEKEKIKSSMKNQF